MSLAKMAAESTEGKNRVVHMGGKAYGVSHVVVPPSRMKEHEELLKSPKSDDRTSIEARFDRQGRPVIYSKTLLGDVGAHPVGRRPKSKVTWSPDGSTSSSDVG